MLSPDQEIEGSYSPLQRHFLSQLARMLRLRSEQSGHLNEEGVRLIDRAIYSTYCDAVDLGVADEAQSLLYKHAVPSRDKIA